MRSAARSGPRCGPVQAGADEPPIGRGWRTACSSYPNCRKTVTCATVAAAARNAISADGRGTARRSVGLFETWEILIERLALLRCRGTFGEGFGIAGRFALDVLVERVARIMGGKLGAAEPPGPPTNKSRSLRGLRRLITSSKSSSRCPVRTGQVYDQPPAGVCPATRRKAQV